MFVPFDLDCLNKKRNNCHDTFYRNLFFTGRAVNKLGYNLFGPVSACSESCDGGKHRKIKKKISPWLQLTNFLTLGTSNHSRKRRDACLSACFRPVGHQGHSQNRHYNVHVIQGQCPKISAKIFTKTAFILRI